MYPPDVPCSPAKEQNHVQLQEDMDQELMPYLRLPDFSYMPPADAPFFREENLMPFFTEELRRKTYPPGSVCLVPTSPIKFYDRVVSNMIIIHLDQNQLNRSHIATAANLVEAVTTCWKGGARYGVLALGIDYGTMVWHMNMLLFDYETMEMERFEPNGGGLTPVAHTKVVDAAMKALLKKIGAGPAGLKFTYSGGAVICPRIGPNSQQAPADNPEFIGYCVGWAILYAHVRLMNPSASPSQVVDAFLGKAPDDLRDYIQRFYNHYEALASLSTDREVIADSDVTAEEQEEAQFGDDDGDGTRKGKGKGKGKHWQKWQSSKWGQDDPHMVRTTDGCVTINIFVNGRKT